MFSIGLNQKELQLSKKRTSGKRKMSTRSVSPGGRPYARLAWSAIATPGLTSGSVTPRLQYLSGTPRGAQLGMPNLGRPQTSQTPNIPLDAVLQNLIGKPRAEWTTKSTSASTTTSYVPGVPSVSSSKVVTTTTSVPTVVRQTVMYNSQGQPLAVDVGGASVQAPAVGAPSAPSTVVVGAGASTCTTATRTGREASVGASVRTRSHSVSDRFASTNLDQSWITPSYRNIGVPGLASLQPSGQTVVSAGASRGRGAATSTRTVIVRKLAPEQHSVISSQTASSSGAHQPVIASTEISSRDLNTTQQFAAARQQQGTASDANHPVRAYHSMKLAEGGVNVVSTSLSAKDTTAPTSTRAAYNIVEAGGAGGGMAGATAPSQQLVPPGSGSSAGLPEDVLLKSSSGHDGAVMTTMGGTTTNFKAPRPQPHNAVKSLTSDATTTDSLTSKDPSSSVQQQSRAVAIAEQSPESRFTLGQGEVAESPILPDHTFSPDGAPLLAEIDLLRGELLKEQTARKNLESELQKLGAQVARLSADVASRDEMVRQRDAQLVEQEKLLIRREQEEKGIQEEHPQEEKYLEETVKQSGSLSPASARGAAHTHHFTDEADVEIQKYVKKHPDFPYAIEKIGRDHYVFGKEKKEVFKRGSLLLVRVGGGTESLLEYMENLHRKGSANAMRQQM